MNLSRMGSDLVLTWQSVPGQTYFIEMSHDLRVPDSFQRLASNLFGQKGTTTYTHVNAVGDANYFYRVGVE